MPRWVRAGLAALVVVAGAPAPVAGAGPTTSDPAKQKTHVDRERSRLAERYDETLAAEAFDRVITLEDLFSHWAIS